MDTDYPLRLLTTTDTSTFGEDGKAVRWRAYRFKLGDQGWFTFRTPADPFDATAFPTYVADLRAHLRQIAQL